MTNSTTNSTNEKTFKDMTLIEKFLVVRAILQKVDANKEIIEFIESRILLIKKKKNNSHHSLTQTQKNNLVVKEGILEVLADGNAYRATDIANLLDLSVQKASAMLRQMVADNKVTRLEVKKVTWFSAK